MIKTLALISFAGLLGTQATCSFYTAPKLRALYDNADQQTAGKLWTPNSAQISTARTIIKSARQTNATRASAYYCLAMAHINTDQSVDSMVRYALRTVGAASEREDAVTGLADALHAIILKTKSPSAFRALASLWLDGAPGESLGDVRVETFEKFAVPLAMEWSKLPAKKQEMLVDDLASAAEDDVALGRIASIGRQVKNWFSQETSR